MWFVIVCNVCVGVCILNTPNYLICDADVVPPVFFTPFFVLEFVDIRITHFINEVMEGERCRKLLT